MKTSDEMLFKLEEMRREDQEFQCKYSQDAPCHTILIRIMAAVKHNANYRK